MARGRKRTSRGSVYRPTTSRTLADGTKDRRHTRYYWAAYRDADGRVVRGALKLPNGSPITDKAVAIEALRALVLRIEREAVGLVDPHVESAGLPFADVLARYLEHLRAKHVTPLHVSKSEVRIKWIASHAGINRLGDLTADRVSLALDALASGTAAPATRKKESKPTSRSPKTVNEYRAAIFGLCAWAVKVAAVLPRNPVERIAVRERRGDIRKKRRALTHAEAAELLAVSGRRALWYEVALLTGLRVGEIQALTWGDLTLDGDAPSIRLRAMTTKARREDVLPLRASLARKLALRRPPFAQPTDRVFRTTPTRTTFQKDCQRAKIHFEADHADRTVDRHALRVTFITWLSMADVAPRVAQKLARHTDLRLTMNVYTDASLLSGREAVSKLPNLHQSATNATAAATGTGCDSVAPGVAMKFASGRPGASRADTGARKGTLTSTRNTSLPATPCHDVARSVDGGGGGNRTPVRRP